jgi:NADP-dependent 3-hydroxy acid dehydrogenase YdfG
MAAQPVWFITGCSTGFGRELAKLVLARGWRAVVTARKPQQIEDLVQAYDESALALGLDVTDKAHVADAVKQAEQRFGRIDVLVNNAGYGYPAASEEGEDDAVRQMFETNFFGLVELTKAVLPGMRKQRSGDDRQHFLDRRSGELWRNRVLPRDEVRGGRPIRDAGAGGEAAGH